MDELVTIIVPVYNRRGYLARCIGSLMGQTYAALQIILVDDGSTDGSGDVCDALARQDTRIEVIHQANGGVSAARNAGLDSMRGAWVAFVDSDDYVSPHYIGELFSAVRNGCDMSLCRYVSVQKDNEPCVGFRRTTRTLYITGREACLRHFGKDADLLNINCGKLYRACLWEELRFPKGKINEDLFVSHALLYRAGRIAVTDAALYAYVQTSNSIMRSTFTEKRLDVLDAWQESVRFYNAVDESDLTHIARRVYSCRVFDARCVCKKHIPHERRVHRWLRLCAVTAYVGAKPVRGYADCSPTKALAYRFKLFLGRWCLPLYALLFVRGRRYI